VEYSIYNTVMPYLMRGICPPLQRLSLRPYDSSCRNGHRSYAPQVEIKYLRRVRVRVRVGRVRVRVGRVRLRVGRVRCGEWR
jgi:hypothetical protein